MQTISPKLFTKMLESGIVSAFPCDMGDWRYACTQNDCITRGIWPMPVRTWMDDLANKLQGKKVLEIYAGGGWIAKYLAFRGVPIVATDDYSYYISGIHNHSPVHKVEKLDAVAAVKKYGDVCDVLLLSWPPYQDTSVLRVANMWNNEVVYIGEGAGGCCATDEFFHLFQPAYTVDMPNWAGRHSRINFGGFVHGKMMWTDMDYARLTQGDWNK